MKLPESHRGAHDAMAEGGDPPPARPGNLRDQPVQVQTVEEPSRLGTLACGIVVDRKRGGRKLGAESAIREAVQGVLACAAKSWPSTRATGWKALAGRPEAGCLQVVMASRPRTPGVGSSTWAKALRYRALLWRASSR
jgi:hypothetical protein